MRGNATKLLQCTRMLRANPRSADALFTLGVIYALEGHRAKALKFLKQLEAVKPSYPGLSRLKRRILKLPSARHRSAPEPSRRGGVF